MIRLRLRPGRRRVLPALALSLACVPLVAVSSPTVDDVVAALRADDDARARTLLEELRTQGLGGGYDVRFLQGVLHLRAGEGAEAARVFDELEASEGPAPTLASGRALSAWAAGRPAEARTRLEHATRLWPEDPGVWANLGDVYRALAARAYQRVRALRRNVGDETPSPTAPVLSAQPGPLPSSGALPPSPVLSIVPTGPVGSASPTTAAEPAATDRSTAPAGAVAATGATGTTEAVAAAGATGTTEAVAAAGATGTTETRVDSTAPADPPPSSGPTASSSPPPSPASPPSSPEATPEPPPPAASVPLPSPESMSSVPAPAPPEPPAESAACFLAGPWPDTPPAEVLEWIRVRNARVLSFRNRSSPYRVYLGPFEDRERAVQTMISLKKDLGIGDVAWVPAGPLRYAVSLGVYMKRESVDRRLRALQALGLDPKVHPPQVGSWLLGSASDLEALLTEWPRTYPDVPLTPERCPPSR